MELVCDALNTDPPTLITYCCQRAEVKVLKGHTNVAFCVNYNPHGNLLASGGYDETVIIWDVARGVFV